MIDTLKPTMTGTALKRADNEVDKLAFTAFGEADFAGQPSWLQTARSHARQQTRRIGFPTIQQEEWKFTNMAPVLQLPLHPAEKGAVKLTPKDIARFTFGLDCYRLVFVDGHFCRDLCLLPADGNDLQVESLSSRVKINSPEVEKHLTRHAHFEENFFAAFNTAFFHEGAFVSIAAGKTADKPVLLLFIGASEQPGATALPRTLVVAHRGANVKIIESHVSLSDAPRVTNAVTELVLGPEAQVEHCKLQRESERAFHIATIQAVQAKDSRWISHSIATGGRIARNQVQALFDAEGAVATLNGLYLGTGEQLIDHHTVVDHAKPRCESHEFYHGILKDRAHGVFNGKIFVRKDAQKTNAKQTNRNLLLSDSAVIDTKPQLEIFADDVKCTHGAVIGQLSDEAIFYLRARGIGEALARRMLIQAFASDVVERIGIEPVRAELEQMLVERFQPTEK